MAGSSTLHVLHQSLNQLKTSKVEIILIVSLCKQNMFIILSIIKLMQNELFRELYDEAKGHEKNVSLNQLVAGSKEFVIYRFINSIRLIIYLIASFLIASKKLHQETNFYVILTKMLNELTKWFEYGTKKLSKSLFIIYRFI